MALNPALREMVTAATAKYQAEREAVSNIIPFKSAEAVRSKRIIAELDKIADSDEPDHAETVADVLEEILEMVKDNPDAQLLQRHLGDVEEILEMLKDDRDA